jgi:hypothetical protein
MQSPAPQKQKIAGRSDSSEENSSADIIENIEAITEEDKKKIDNNISSDSSDSTIAEDKDLPKTEGGPIKQTVTVVAEALAIPASTSGVDSTRKSSPSSSSSTSSSSTGGSSNGSLDSSDSSRSLYSSDLDTDTDTSPADKKKKYKYNKMPSSSIIKSPVSDGSRATFEEWHSLWEVFGHDNGFDEYQSIAPHPDLPVDGHNAAKPVKTEKKALRKNKKAIASLQVSFSGIIYTLDAMIEVTIDDAGMWPYGRIHLALVDLYNTYWPKSRLDRIQLNMDKLTIKMGDSVPCVHIWVCTYNMGLCIIMIQDSY